MNISLFSVPSGDLSVYYLGQIFGQVSSVLVPARAPMLMGTMLNVLNTAALSLGVLMILYTTVVGLLSTAAEGEFMGKKFGNMWVPVRMVFGILDLIQIPTFYY